MLKKQEIDVLSNLRQDSRQRFTQIARKTGLHKITVSGIEKRLRKDKLIRYIPLIDFRKLGYSIMISLAIKSSDEKINEKVIDFLDNHPGMNSLSTISGRFNILAELVFKNMSEMHDFLEKVEEFDIDSMQYHHMIEEIKKEEFLINI